MRERLEDRGVNYVQVFVNTESGCDPKGGEYTMSLGGFVGCLELSSPGGVDDISLIKEAIENDLDFDKLPKEGCTEIVLRESGEWEDVFWHKYYVIERTTVHEA